MNPWKQIKVIWSKFEVIEDYLRLFKLRLEEIYGIKVNGVKIRSKCDWYKYGEKTSKFFLKNRFVQSQIRKLIIEGGKRINRTKWNH